MPRPRSRLPAIAGGLLCLLLVACTADGSDPDPRPKAINVQSGTAPTPIVVYRSLDAARPAVAFALLAPTWLPAGVWPEPYVLVDAAGISSGRNGTPGVELAYYVTSGNQALSIEEYSPQPPPSWQDRAMPGSATGLPGQEEAVSLPQGPGWLLPIALDSEQPLSITNQTIRVRFRQGAVAVILSGTRLTRDDVLHVAGSLK